MKPCFSKLSLLLFSLFFLFSVQSLLGQETGNPFPAVLIKNDTGTSVPLRMSELKVEVKVIGNLATTVMEMNFHNDLDRVLEGQLYFPLGEGQTVSRFAMDIEGKLREGVVVDKKQGRIAFENTIRRQIDPGLLEWTAGNNFKSRVYPIPAKGDKRILIAYEQELKYAEDGPQYLLPLKFEEPLDLFSLKIEVFDQPEMPDLHGNQLEGLNFEKFERTFTAKLEKKNYLANQQLAFRLPKPSRYTEIFIENEAKEGDYFFLRLNPEITEKAKEMPKKICLLWDVSNSSGGRDLEKELALLDGYFAKVKEAEVRMLTFSASIHDRNLSQVSNGEWPALRSAIEGLKYDGGTQFGCLDLRKIDADEFLLFSDGISNFGDSHLIPSDKPVYTINYQATAEHTKLTQIAEETGGRYLNLNELKPQEALNALSLLPFRFINAEYNPGAISATYPATSRPITGDFSLAGRLKTSTATITLNFGIGTEVLDKQVIVLDKRKQETKSGLVRRIWAQKKLAELERNADENKESIIELGKAYSLVTRHTSLIVLDRLEDYIQYKIVPPKEMQAAYFEAIENQWSRETNTKKKKVDQVAHQFEERVKWWETSFQWPKPKPAPNRADNTRTSDSLSVISGGVAAQYGNETGGVIDFEDEEEEPAMEMERIQQEVNRNEERVDDSESWGDDFGADDWGGDDDWDGEAEENVETIELEETVSEMRVMETVEQPEADVDAFESVTIQMNGAASSSLEEVATEGAPPPPTLTLTPNADGDTDNFTLQNIAETQNLAFSDGFDDEDDWGDDFEEEFSPRMDSANANNLVFTSNRSRNGNSNRVAARDMMGKGDIQLYDWDPDEPYLTTLKSTPSSHLYATYLSLKPEYGASPAFYLDCSDYFRKQGKKKESLRILSNIAEMELDNYQLLRILGHRLQQLEETDLAVLTFREVLNMREEEPQSYRDLAIALADQGEAQEAVDLLYEMVEGDWNDRFPDIEVIAVQEINQIHHQAKRKPSLAKVDPRLRKHLPVNVRVAINWSADNCDMDLWVTDPTGEKCFYSNKRTKIGGLMSNDFTGGYGPEEFLLRKAMPGTYKVQVNYFGSRQQNLAGATTVQVSLFTDYGTSKEKRRDVTLRLKDTKETIDIGEFIY